MHNFTKVVVLMGIIGFPVFAKGLNLTLTIDDDKSNQPICTKKTVNTLNDNNNIVNTDNSSSGSIFTEIIDNRSSRSAFGNVFKQSPTSGAAVVSERETE